MCVMAGHFVLKPEFLFLESVEKVFVRVAAMLFFFDQSMQRGVLGFQFLGNSLVHRSISFRQTSVSGT